MDVAQATALLNKYPPDHTRVGRGLSIAVAIHFFAAATVCLIMYWLGIISLKELLEKGGAIAESGPAPEQQMIIELKLDQIQPPPTDQIEFVKQILKEKPVVVPPKPPEPKPKPEPPKPQPKYTAPKATGAGNSTAVSAFVKGSTGFPSPSYPLAALQAGQGGTVRMHISFDSGGGIQSADVTSSSGVTLLDTWTRNFIYGHWKNASMAGRSVDVPIIYDPSQHTVR